MPVHAKRFDVQRGFALPTILILSVVLLMILLAAVAAMTTIRQALVTQQYDRMAKLAAESGIAYAAACLNKNDYNVTWSDTSPLVPGKDCKGGTPCPDPKCFVVNTADTQSTFRVGLPEGSGTGTQFITAKGVVSLLRKSDGKPWKTYETIIQARTGGSVTVNSIAFGYSGAGTYFLTLSRDGNVRAVGANGLGQLGVGDKAITTTPKIVSMPPGSYASMKLSNPIATNFLNSGYAVGIVSSDGDAYFSGGNDYAQLGYTGPSPSTFVKFPLPNDGPNGKPLGDVTLAVPIFNNNYVITKSGYAYSAGACDNGQTGTGAMWYSCTEASPHRLWLPTPNSATPSTIPINITGDAQVRHVLMRDGSVYGWGADDNVPGHHAGALGIGKGNGNPASTPRKVLIDGQMNCATNGSSNCPFGAGDRPCTFGDTSTVHCIVDIQETGRATYLLANDGTVWASGSDWGYGMLGQGTDNDRTDTFKQITAFPADTYSHRVTSIHADAFSVTMLTGEANKPWTNAVYTVGLNRSGLAGCGAPSSSPGASCPEKATTPVRFQLPSGVYPLSMYNTSNVTTTLDSGSWTFTDNLYVIASDKKVYAAGDNTYGQLGDGCVMTKGSGPNLQCEFSSNGQPRDKVGNPVVMSVLDGSTSNKTAVSIQAGRGTAVIKTQSGVVYAVGLNDAGQLGDGTTNNSSIPRANKYLNLSTILYF